MANTYAYHGFMPVSPNGEQVATLTRAKKSSTTGNVALFVGSPIVVSSGVVDAVTENANTSGMTGAILVLYDSTGAKVQNLAYNAAGTCVISYLPTQIYQAIVESTNYATTDAGSQRYVITEETGTVASGDNLGDDYSKRLIGADDADGQILAGGLVKRPDNTAGEAYCEIECTIASAKYVAP